MRQGFIFFHCLQRITDTLIKNNADRLKNLSALLFNNKYFYMIYAKIIVENAKKMCYNNIS